jgi:hypothetical protein
MCMTDPYPTGYRIENEGLKNAKLKPDSAWEFDQQGCMCRLIPESAVILITVDEQARETIFGFMRYPEAVQDAHGKVLLATPLGRRWYFRDHVKSADPRYRQIVERFRQAGYLQSAEDEFQQAAGLEQKHA